MRRIAIAVLIALLPLGFHAAHAADPLPKTATVSAWPYSGTYHVGQQFQVSIYVSANGTPFYAATGGISVSPNLALLSVTTPETAPGCNHPRPPSFDPEPGTALQSGTGVWWFLGYGDGPTISNNQAFSCVIALLNLQVVGTGLGVVNVAVGPCAPFLLAANPGCAIAASVSANTATLPFSQNILKATMDGVYSLVP